MTCLYCTRKVMGLGLCSMHYLRWRNRRPMEAPLHSRATKPRLAPDALKLCSRCEKEKPVSEFRNKTEHKQGYCSTCDNARRRERYHAWPEDKRRARRTAGRKALLRREFNLSLEEYDALFAAQGGLCAVCKQPETRKHQNGTVKRLAVDHDHACCPGKQSCGQCIRGLLCTACNVSIGQLDEDPARIRALADYVEQRSVKKEHAA